MKRILQFLFISVLIVNYYSSAQATIRYVKEGGAGIKSGLSWENASDDIQAMINASSNSDQVWVTTGTYKPTHRADNFNAISTTDRYNAFVLKKDVSLLGGFMGNETSINSRSANATTILSGDLGTIGNMTDNAYHVVISAGTIGTASLDGFTITGGNATAAYSDQVKVNGHFIHGNSGGGFYIVSSSPALTNVIISNNEANYGAGIYNEGTSSVLTNVIIVDNKAVIAGGGIRNDYELTSSPTLMNVLIARNTAGVGGGMQILGLSSSNLINVTIANNKATNDEGGGIYIGMVNFRAPSPKLYNCIIYGNTTSSNIESNIQGDEYATPSYSHCLIGGSGGSVNWNSSLGTNVIGNIDADPLFVGSSMGDYHLRLESPCIDKGDKTKIPSGVTTDLAGNIRIIGSNVDMGAYEYNGNSNKLSVVNENNSVVVIYPNPVYNIMNIDIENSTDNIKQIIITDIKGTVFYNENINTTHKEISVKNYPKGIYLVNITTDRINKTNKVIINN